MAELSYGRARRLFIGAVVAMAAIALSAGPVMADVDIFTKGTVGEHSLDDTPEHGGGVCRYSAGGHLRSFKVRAPTVYAIDGTSARNHGRVGWRVLIDTYDPNNSSEPAHIFYKGDVHKAWAYDDEPAPFVDEIVDVPIPENDYQYRLFVKMLWYRADGSVRGASVHVITQYKWRMGSEFTMNYGNCVGTIYPG
jgi:hypothetical protein